MIFLGAALCGTWPGKQKGATVRRGGQTQDTALVRSLTSHI